MCATFIAPSELPAARHQPLPPAFEALEMALAGAAIVKALWPWLR